MKKVTKKQAIQASLQYEDAIKVMNSYNGVIPATHKRKEGIKYILCEHLQKKEMEDEVSNMYIGKKTRVILCAVCTGMMIGHVIRVATRTSFRFEEEEVQKEDIPVTNDLLEKFRNWWRKSWAQNKNE